MSVESGRRLRARVKEVLASLPEARQRDIARNVSITWSNFGKIIDGVYLPKAEKFLLLWVELQEHGLTGEEMFALVRDPNPDELRDELREIARQVGYETDDNGFEKYVARLDLAGLRHTVGLLKLVQSQKT